MNPTRRHNAKHQLSTDAVGTGIDFSGGAPNGFACRCLRICDTLDSVAHFAANGMQIYLDIFTVETNSTVCCHHTERAACAAGAFTYNTCTLCMTQLQ
jgi:hypothetical protein